MSEFVADCPRCRAKKITFDLSQSWNTVVKHNWQQWYEAFCHCRNCNRSTIFVLSQRDIKDEVYLTEGLHKLERSVNQYADYQGFICIKDLATTDPPDDLPEEIDAAFREGAACHAIQCYNASAAMFRLCIDLATRAMLPEIKSEDPPARVRRSLGLRLEWLFGQGLLPGSLEDLSTCIKDDGNDGVHQGNLEEADADDVLDFTAELLRRIYTEPARLEAAKARREARRQSE